MNYACNPLFICITSGCEMFYQWSSMTKICFQNCIIYMSSIVPADHTVVQILMDVDGLLALSSNETFKKKWQQHGLCQYIYVYRPPFPQVHFVIN